MLSLLSFIVTIATYILLNWSWHRQCKQSAKMNYELGVLQGYIIGKYPAQQKGEHYQDAMRVIDGIQADIAWKMALEEESNDLG